MSLYLIFTYFYVAGRASAFLFYFFFVLVHYYFTLLFYADSRTSDALWLLFVSWCVCILCLCLLPFFLLLLLFFLLLYVFMYHTGVQGTM